MTIDVAFGQLRSRLATLLEALETLGITVDEDQPGAVGVAVASYLSDDVVAARGPLEEAVSTLGSLGPSAAGSPTHAPWREALVFVHQRFHSFTRKYAAELASRARLEDLGTVAHERGQPWAGWVDVVRQEIDQCASLADDVADALLQCWQELLDRAGTIAVQNTVVGNHLGASAPTARHLQ